MFFIQNHRIIELTTKSRKLTEFLVNQNSKIIVPEFIISEIKRKGFRSIIDDYVNSGGKNIVDFPNHHIYAFKLKLRNKVNENFNNLLNKDYFIVERYVPEEYLMANIKDFFMGCADVDKVKIFLDLKNRDNQLPSDEDLKLILFSKYKQAPLISNDYDILISLRNYC